MVKNGDNFHGEFGQEIGKFHHFFNIEKINFHGEKW